MKSTTLKIIANTILILVLPIVGTDKIFNTSIYMMLKPSRRSPQKKFPHPDDYSRFLNDSYAEYSFVLFPTFALTVDHRGEEETELIFSYVFLNHSLEFIYLVGCYDTR